MIAPDGAGAAVHAGVADRPGVADSGALATFPALGLVLLSVLLSLDETSVAQTWLSQPLPAGLLAGAICGDPLTGIAIGLPMQLVALGNPPVGQTFTGERVSAVIAAVGGTILTGHALPLLRQVGAQAALPTAGALGWTLVAIALFSIAGNKVVQLERGTHFVWMLEGHRTLWDGRLDRFERLLRRCVLATSVRAAVLCVLWLIVMVGFWMPLYEGLPPRLVRALALLPLLAPPLAVAAAIDLYGLRASWKWIAGGLAAAALLARWLA